MYSSSALQSRVAGNAFIFGVGNYNVVRADLGEKNVKKKIFLRNDSEIGSE